MLNILGGWQKNCSGWTRRHMLQAGGAGMLGLSLPRVLAAESAQRPSGNSPRAKNVIFLVLYGGPSQLETFDMKPDAPSTLRGPFKPIPSRTPELRICELMPQLAGMSDKFSVIRTMSHPQNDHSSGGHYIQTGHPWHIPIGAGFNATEKDWPSIGSVVDYLDERSGASATRNMPTNVFLPNRLGYLQKYSTKLVRPGGYGGWLGRAYDPLATNIQKRDEDDNPYFRPCTDDELNFCIQGTETDASLTLDRLEKRRSLLDQFDSARRDADSNSTTATYEKFRDRALTLVSSEKVRTALDVRLEPAATRDRYGRKLFGQSVLVARRLIEAGTRFVTVGWDCPNGYSWDSHTNSVDVQNHLIPGLDQALSALLADLSDRGLLDETLVIAMGEMGRTPKANAAWGRNHWSTLFPAVLAGGGVKNGIVYGSSDKDAAYAMDHRTTPEDLAATVFHLLGIDHHHRIPDSQGRPWPLVDEGHVVSGILS